MYPEDTWWLHCDFLSTSPSKKPLDTCWVILQRKLHFDHHVPRDQIVITFEKKAAQKPVGSLWKKTLVSFIILFTMYPLWIWATHWDFFYKVLHNIITMSPAGSSQRNHKEITLWFSFVTNSQRTLWVYSWIHYDYIVEYFMKEVSMSGSDPEWIHCKQNYERNQGFLSQRTHWFLCCFLFKCNHNLIPGYMVIKVQFSL